MSTEDGRKDPLLFDHYAVERVLGSGAAGMVYLARDQRIGRLVALKTLRARSELLDHPDGSEAESFRRFRREAQVSASLLHPNIVTLYEVGAHSNRLVWMAMEYVEGESLASILNASGRLPLDFASRIADDVLRGLAYAHGRGVIHRDIKPGNILIARDGTAKIADFGIAHAADANLTELTDHGRLLGTPHYMSPEQIAGRRLDARSDLYSVGVVLYEILTGKKPFDSDSLSDLLYSVVNRPVPPLRTVAPELPRWCGVFVDRMLEKRPSDRWEDAATAARELRRSAGLSGDFERPAREDLRRHETSASADETPTTRISAVRVDELRRIAQRKVPPRMAAAILAGLVLMLAGSVAALVRSLTSEPPPVVDATAEAALSERRQLLREAEILYESGAFGLAIDRYDQYLERWPGSATAIEGRAKAEAALSSRVINLRTPADARDARRGRRPARD